MLRSEGMLAQGCSFAASHLFWYISFNCPLAQQFTLAPSSLSWKLSPLNSLVHKSSCCPTFCPLYSAEPSRPAFLVFQRRLDCCPWTGWGVKKLICCLILKLAGPVGGPDPVRVVVNFNHGWSWSGIIVLGLSIPEGQSVAEVTASAATACVCVCLFLWTVKWHTMQKKQTCRCGSVH